MRIVFLYFFAESNSLLNHWGDARRASYVFGKLLMYPVKLAMYHDDNHYEIHFYEFKKRKPVVNII